MQRMAISLDDGLAEAFDVLAAGQGYQSRSDATRDLARRLPEFQHDRRELVISSTHVHLDHHSCLESTILKGPINAVRSLGQSIQAERGVFFLER